MRTTLAFLKPYKLRLALVLFFGLLTVGANVALMGTSGYLIAKAALRPESVLLLWIPIVGVRFFGLSRAAFRYVERLLSHDLTFRVLKDIRVWLFGRWSERGETLLEKEKSGGLVGAAVSDVETMQNVYLKSVVPIAVALLTAVGCVAAMAPYGKPAVVLAALLAVGGIAIPAAAYRLGKSPGERWVANRAQLYEETSELLTGLRELTLAGELEARLDRLARIQREGYAGQAALNRIAAAADGLLLAVSRLAAAGVLFAAIPLAVQGKVPGVMLPSLTLMAAASFEAIFPLPGALKMWGATAAAVRRLLRLGEGGEAPAAEAAAAPETVAAAGAIGAAGGATGAVGTVGAVDAAGAIGAKEEAIRFRRVTMRYEGGGEPSLKDVAFAVRQGEKLAVAGESGAGKSSLLQALLGLRPIEAGGIEVLGAAVGSRAAEAHLALFAVVPQHVQLFHATVADNLRIAKPDASDGQLAEALHLAMLADKIAALPDGLATVVGEDGDKWSGGERQRLALARALLKEAPIFLFDEPSSGLDPLTREAFASLMRTALRGKTVLWITHKPQELQAMDGILTLRDGRIVSPPQTAEAQEQADRAERTERMRAG